MASGDGWQVYSDGRVGAYASWIHGQDYPVPTHGIDSSGNSVTAAIFTVKGGGCHDVTEQGVINDPSLNIPLGVTLPDQGTIDTISIRRGFSHGDSPMRPSRKHCRGQVEPSTISSGSYVAKG